jgi:hypothetical protein
MIIADNADNKKTHGKICQDFKLFLTFSSPFMTLMKKSLTSFYNDNDMIIFVHTSLGINNKHPQVSKQTKKAGALRRP